MGFARRKLGLVLALSLLGLALTAPFALGRKKEKQNSAGQMEEQKRALHALNRLTFGPRAGDVERVTAMGVDRWIDEQLHPEKINDSALDARLAPLRTLRMDTREIVENFPPPQLIKAVEQGKQSLPSDPVKRAVYQDQKSDHVRQFRKRDIVPRGSRRRRNMGRSVDGDPGESRRPVRR